MTVKRRSGVILEIACIGIISMLPIAFLPKGLISFTIMDLHIDPYGFLLKLSNMYNPDRYFGEFSARRLGYIFPIATYFSALHVMGLSPYLIERLWLFLIFFIGGISMNVLFRIMNPTSNMTHRIIASLAYMFNPYVFIMLHESPFLLLSYQFLPLTLAAFALGIEKPQKSLQVRWAGIIALLLMLLNIDATYILIVIYVLIAYWLYYLLTSYSWSAVRSSAIFVFEVLAFYFLFNFWWILPQIQYVTDPSLLKTLALEGPSQSNQASSFVEVFRMFGYWGFYSGYKGVYYFSYAPQYINDHILVLLTMILPMLAISSLFFTRERKTIFFSLLLLTSIFMAVGAYPPENPENTGKLYQWLYRNIPYFAVFRESFKFQLITCLSYSFMLGVLCQSFSVRKITKFNIPKFIIPIAVSSILLINISPMLEAGVFEKNRVVDVPVYWYDAADWLNSQYGDFAVMMLPRQYFPVYRWEGCTPCWTASDISEPLFNKQLVFQSPGIKGVIVSDQLVDTVYKEFFSNQTEFVHLLAQLGIKYILIRGDVDWEFYNVEPPEKILSYISSYGLKHVKTFGPLSFYEVPVEPTPRVFSSSKVLMIHGMNSYSIAAHLSNKVGKEAVYITQQPAPLVTTHVYLLNHTNTSVVFSLPKEGVYTIKFVPLHTQESIKESIKEIWIRLDNSSWFLLEYTNTTGVWRSDSHFITEGTHTLTYNLIYLNDSNITSSNTFTAALILDQEDSTLNGRIVTYSRLTPTLFHVELTNDTILVLNTAFHDQWQIFKGRINVLEVLWSHPVSNAPHFMVNGFANAWLVSDGGEYTLIFRPQVLFLYGILISITSILVWVLTIGIHFVYCSTTKTRKRLC
jgi:hypothetical protein